MKEIAPGVYLMRGIPPNSNVYLVGDVLVDAGTRHGLAACFASSAGATFELLL